MRCFFSPCCTSFVHREASTNDKYVLFQGCCDRLTLKRNHTDWTECDRGHVTIVRCAYFPSKRGNAARMCSFSCLSGHSRSLNARPRRTASWRSGLDDLFLQNGCRVKKRLSRPGCAQNDQASNGSKSLPPPCCTAFRKMHLSLPSVLRSTDWSVRGPRI